MERFASEFVDDRPATAFQDSWYFDPCGSEFEVRLEIDRQKQRLAKLRACRREDGEKIAQGSACLTRDDCFKRDPLSFIRAPVDDDLAPAPTVLDFARPLVERRPLKARKRRIVEMAFDDVADESRLAITARAGQVELAATINSAVAVVVALALE